MAYDIDSFFYPKNSYLTLLGPMGGEVHVVGCLACGSLVDYKERKFHYEFHLKHRDMPRKNNR